jgi:hypothetical protein
VITGAGVIWGARARDLGACPSIAPPVGFAAFVTVLALNLAGSVSTDPYIWLAASARARTHPAVA